VDVRGLLLRGRRGMEGKGRERGGREGKGLRGGEVEGEGFDIAWPDLSLVYATPLLQHQAKIWSSSGPVSIER